MILAHAPPFRWFFSPPTAASANEPRRGESAQTHTHVSEACEREMVGTNTELLSKGYAMQSHQASLLTMKPPPGNSKHLRTPRNKDYELSYINTFKRSSGWVHAAAPAEAMPPRYQRWGRVLLFLDDIKRYFSHLRWPRLVTRGGTAHVDSRSWTSFRHGWDCKQDSRVCAPWTGRARACGHIQRSWN